MKHLDASINSSVLDESFNSVTGEETPVTIGTHPTRTTLINSNLYSIITSQPKTIQAEPTVGIIPRSIYVAPVVKPVVNTVANPVVSPVASLGANPTQLPVMMGGGSGGAVDSPEQSSAEVGDTKKVIEDKMILGVKANYVYGLGAIGALVFVYFKFIK